MKLLIRLILAVPVGIAVLVLAWQAESTFSREILLADAGKLQSQNALRYAYQKAQTASRVIPGARTEKSLYRLAYRRGDYEQALIHARATTGHSPADARAWLHVAVAKAGLRQFDREFRRAFERAYHYARYYDAIQLRLARLSALHWSALDIETRRLAAGSISYILDHQFRYRFIDFLFRNNRERLVCPAFADTDELRGWCDTKRKLRAICSKREFDLRLTRWCAERGIGAP